MLEKSKNTFSRPGSEEAFRYICIRGEKGTTCAEVTAYLLEQGFNQHPPKSVLEDIESN
jgi:hypothetical protein